MRSDHPHRRSISHVYHQSIGSRLVRDLGWPCRQIAGQPPFRRVCKDYDFVSGQSTYLRLHRRSESLHAFPVEQFHQPLHILPMNIFPESREICVPRIPERNREQGEHENAECDVGKCQPERGKGEELDHMCCIQSSLSPLRRGSISSCPVACGFMSLMELRLSRLSSVVG